MEELTPRLRLGTIPPTVGPGGTHAYQFYRLLPRGVIEIPAPLGLEGYTPACIEEALGRYWGCVARLARYRVDRIALTGIPVAALAGRQRVLDLLDETRKRAGVPADAALEAAIAGMHHLGVRSVAVVSRWGDEVNEALATYLDQAGLRMEGVTPLDRRSLSLEEAQGLSLEQGMELVMQRAREAMDTAPQVEGILIPGGAWLTLHAIPMLEQEYGRPVITSLNATVWSAVIRPGVVAPIQGWGRLLASP